MPTMALTCYTYINTDCARTEKAITYFSLLLYPKGNTLYKAEILAELLYLGGYRATE